MRTKRAERTLDEEFREYHGKHPDIWEKFEALALELIGRGVTRYGGQDILGFIRWHETVANPAKPWKVNQRMMSRYVRMFREKHEGHRDFFEIRKLRPSRKGSP